MNPHSLKLSPESDLIKCIKDYSFSLSLNGFVSGVVGNLREVCIKCPGDKEINKFQGNLEILSLNGSFNSKSLHISGSEYLNGFRYAPSNLLSSIGCPNC